MGKWSSWQSEFGNQGLIAIKLYNTINKGPDQVDSKFNQFGQRQLMGQKSEELEHEEMR